MLPCLQPGRFPDIAIDGKPVPRNMNPSIEGSGVVLNGQGGQHTIVVNP